MELYEWLLTVYRSTAREKLLEFLKGHPNLETLKSVSDDELLKTYAEGVANNMASRMKWNPTAN